ncbi:hypothetical protein BDR03DRAFT_71758 [Suillus americanus]|nr:hypothetical protein BDR03DRAFT_71758 [Suillus americanus]
MSEDHRQKPPLEATGEATAGESLSQHRSGFRQTLWKFKKNATKKVSIHLMRSRYQTPAVQNADYEGAPSNQNIEPSGKPASKVLDAPPGVEEIPGFQLVNAELRGTESMRLLGGHGISVVSAAKDSPKDLAAADDLHTTDLQSLKIFHIVIEQLVDVWVTLLGWK